jgi:hypothetical protein
VDPESPLDLIDFWNYRLFHSFVLPISARWLQDSPEFLAEFLKSNYRPPPGNPHGVMITATIQFGRSIGDERVKTLVGDTGLSSLEDYVCTIKPWYERIWVEIPTVMLCVRSQCV